MEYGQWNLGETNKKQIGKTKKQPKNWKNRQYLHKEKYNHSYSVRKEKLAEKQDYAPSEPQKQLKEVLSVS